jgi:DNA-binding NtrC family response regulator
MTVEDRTTFRAVILSGETVPAAYRAGQLLKDLGHEVAPAQSPDEAMDLLQQDQTELLIVDVANSPANRLFVNQLPDLPATHFPREVAIFSDAADDSLRSLRKRISPSKVHIFLKPLHIHGLLNVVRRLEDQVAGAQ